MSRDKCSHCGRTMITRPGDLEATCGECQMLPDSCPCDPVPAAAGSQEAAVRRLVLTPASEIEPEPVVWAWEDYGGGRIPAGSLGLMAGREGTGKSSFLIWMAARITTGTLPGSFGGVPRGVIYVAVEDSWKYTIVPRLIAAGANLDLVYRAEVQVIEGDTVSLSLPVDNRLLEEAITGFNIALVALDPLMSAISDTLDTHVNRQVRQALDPLARLADRTGAVFAGIAHFNKSAGTDASSLITGSGAFKDVARFVFAFAVDSEDGSKVITQTKNSLGHSDLPSLAYRIIEATVETRKGDARVGKLILDGPSDRTVQDILTIQGGAAQDEQARSQDASEYLRDALSGGPRRTKEVEEEAKEAHGISQRTLERARKKLRVPARKRDSGPVDRDGHRKSEWWISLPEHEGDLDEPFKGDQIDQDESSAKTATPPHRHTATPPGAPGGVDGGDRTKTANPANGLWGVAEWRSGGLDGDEVAETTPNPRPDCAHAECHAALYGRCLTPAEREQQRKLDGKPDPADWPEGSIGAASYTAA